MANLKTISVYIPEREITLYPQDYIFCYDCDEFVDLHRYDKVEDTGHEACKWRYVTEEEFEVCVEDCKEFGCFTDE